MSRGIPDGWPQNVPEHPDFVLIQRCAAHGPGDLNDEEILRVRRLLWPRHKRRQKEDLFVIQRDCKVLLCVIFGGTLLSWLTS